MAITCRYPVTYTGSCIVHLLLDIPGKERISQMEGSIRLDALSTDLLAVLAGARQLYRMVSLSVYRCEQFGNRRSITEYGDAFHRLSHIGNHPGFSRQVFGENICKKQIIDFANAFLMP